MPKLKQLITALAILLSTSAVAQPDKDWWACQYVESVGLIWENGQWERTGFKNRPPFVLMSDGNGLLTKESVAKMFSNTSPAPSIVVCSSEITGHISCANPVGSSLFFNPYTANGGYSYTYGASQAQTDEIKDTVSVSAFECTKG